MFKNVLMPLVLYFPKYVYFNGMTLFWIKNVVAYIIIMLPLLMMYGKIFVSDK
jgi:hypothetical protein